MRPLLALLRRRRPLRWLERERQPGRRQARRAREPTAAAAAAPSAAAPVSHPPLGPQVLQQALLLPGEQGVLLQLGLRRSRPPAPPPSLAASARATAFGAPCQLPCRALCGVCVL